METSQVKPPIDSNDFTSGSTAGPEVPDLGHLVFDELKKREHGATRDELVAKFSLPRTTIYDALRPYLKTKAIVKEKKVETRKARGRPTIYFVAKE